MEKTKTTPAKRKKKPNAAAEALSEGPTSTVQVLLNVRLWIAEGAEVPPLALAMVGDLLSASPCEIHDQSNSSIAASFSDAAQAVMAARRLRRLFQGFSRGFKTGQLGGCFILSNAVEGLPGIEPHLVERLLVMARGNHGEAFLVGDLCEAARSIPGLRFDAISADWMQSGADRLYRPVLKLMPPVQMESYVDEAPEGSPPAINAIAPAAGPGVSAPVSSPAEVPAKAQASEGAVRTAGELVPAAGVEVGGFARAEKAPRQGFPLGWVAGAAVMAVVAGVAILVVHMKKPPVPSQQVIPAAHVSPATVNPGGSPPLPVVSSQPAPAEAPKSVASTPRLTAKEIAAAKRKGVSPDSGQDANGGDTGAEAAKKDAGDKTSIPLSADEINRALAIADKESGDGKYDDAIQNYRTILKHDPGNVRAKEGLERATRNKGSE